MHLDQVSAIEDTEDIFEEDEELTQFAAVVSSSLSLASQTSSQSSSSGYSSQATQNVLDKTLNDDPSLCGLCYVNKKQLLLMPCGQFTCFECWTYWMGLNTVNKQYRSKRLQKSSQEVRRGIPCPYKLNCPSEDQLVLDTHKCCF